MRRLKHNLVLVIEPKKAPRVVDLDGSLETYQKTVGGYIEAVYPFDDPVALIVNEEGKLNGLPLNRALRDEDGDCYDIVAGTFLVVGLSDDDFTTLSPDQLVKYAVHFAVPEHFVKTSTGGFTVIPMLRGEVQ